jgi:hypothetical protein
MGLLDGFFTHVLIRLVCQPLSILHILVRPAIAVFVVNPVVDKGTVLTTMEHTLILRDSQAGGSSLLGLSLVHLCLFLAFTLVTTRTSHRLDRDQSLERRLQLLATPGIGVAKQVDSLAKTVKHSPNKNTTIDIPVQYHLWTGRLCLLTLDLTI